MTGKLKDFFRYVFFGPVGAVVSCLPHPTVVWLGKRAGDLSWAVRRRRRRVAEEELRRLSGGELDEAECVRAVRDGFRLSFVVLLEMFCYPRIHGANIDRWIRIEGREKLDTALARGRGVLMVLVHFGANLLVMAALGHRGYPVNQLGSRPDDWNRLSGIRPSPAERWVFRRRLAMEHSLPAEFIYIDRSMRPIYRCLKRGEVVIMAVDGRAGKRFLQASVGRYTMNLSSGPFRIAAATGAALLPVFPILRHDGVHRLEIEEPIVIDTGSSETRTASEAARLFGKRLHRRIMAHPDHYCMLMAEARMRASLDPIPLFEEYRV